MRGSWIITHFMVLAGSLVKLLDGTPHDWTDQDTTPSCEELRTFWNMVSRTAKMSEMTNEIPILPWEAFVRAGEQKSLLDGGRRKPLKPVNSLASNALQNGFFMRGSPLSIPETFQPIPAEIPYPAPPNWIETSNQESNGAFGVLRNPGFSELHADPGINAFRSPTKTAPVTRKKAERDILHRSAWGIPSEVGMFGRFIDMDEGVPRSPASKHFTEDWSDPFPSLPSHEPTAMRESCFQFINKDCTMDAECTCAGWETLRCHRGKCVNQHLTSGKEGGYGLWHEGPVPTSKLGRLKRLRRNSRYIFM